LKLSTKISTKERFYPQLLLIKFYGCDIILSVMKELFDKYCIKYDEDALKKFKIFEEMLYKSNKEFNLTAIKEGREMEIKHFLDSAVGVDKFVENSSVVEIGSGGGFPSVPIMILRKDLKFTLLESVGKKCNFLRSVIGELGLNAEVINARAEDVGKESFFRESFDHATARAVARLNILSEYCLPLVKVGGTFIAYKANAEEEIRECENAFNVLGGKIKEVKEYYLPDEEGKRTIIEIEKIKSTPNEYPRGNGKERKKPL